ncbi:MAG: type II secretion system protein [Chlamydiales bacterium]
MMKESPRTRLPFTLLEVCLCVTIVLLISGFLGVKIKESIERQRFLSSVSEFARELKRMQGFALSYRSDFGMRVFEEKGKFYYKLFTDEPLDGPGQEFSTKRLNGLTALTLGHKKVKAISVEIHPSGQIDPQAVVGLSHRDEERFFDLRAALHIKAVERYPNES